MNKTDKTVKDLMNKYYLLKQIGDDESAECVFQLAIKYEERRPDMKTTLVDDLQDNN